MGLGAHEEGRKIVADYSMTLYDKLAAIQKPDSYSPLTPNSPEENTQTAAFIESMITICAYAGQGNIEVIQNLIVALTDAIQGRVAAEEALDIHKLDQGKVNKPVRENNVVAESGQPSIIDDRNIWPGDNLEPSTVLVVGLGFLAGECDIARHMIVRFAERVMKYGDVHAKRAVPFLLAMSSLGVMSNEIVDDLSKLCLHYDKETAFNSLLALGLVGCGTQNFKIAGILRHCIESKFYQEEGIDHIVMGA